MTNRYLRSVGKTVIPQVGQQAFDRGGVLRRSRLDPQDVLLAFSVYAHRAEDVMIGETLAIDIDHQNLDVLPAAFLQLLELFDASVDGLAADGAARYPDRRRHLRQDFLVFPRRDTPQQRTQHVLAKAPILAQHFIRGDFHFAFGFVSQAGPLHFQLAVRQLDTAGLRSVVADIAASFARRAWASHLLGAQDQDLFQGLVSDLMDYGFYYLAGVLDQVQDGKQDLPIGSAELLDNRG